MYKIVSYTVSKSLNKIKKYSSKLADLIKESFDYDYDENDINNLVMQSKYVFIAFDGLEPIGSAYINSEKIYRYNEEKKTYTYINESTKPEENYIIIDPMISGLCRKQQDKYKGVGSAIIKKIFYFLHKKNIEYVYLIPESLEGKGSITNDYCNISEHETDSDTKFCVSNKRLIRFYKSLGFIILDKYYYVNALNDYSTIYYNILSKKLSDYK